MLPFPLFCNACCLTLLHFCILTRFFSLGTQIWALSHQAWNKLMHILYGNTSVDFGQDACALECACTGWRIAPVENWQAALLDQCRLYDLGVGGTLNDRTFFDVHVRPLVHKTYEAFCAQNPAAEEQCILGAQQVQAANGHPHLWVCMRDCVRSSMCVRSGGRPEHAGMCLACSMLSADHGFQQKHCHTEPTSDGGPLDKRHHHKDMTRDELIAKLEARAQSAHTASKREQRHEISSTEQIAKAQARSEVAREQVCGLLHELMATVTRATDAEQEAAAARMELVISAQQQASQETALEAAQGAATEAAKALKDAQASLHASAIAEVLMSESLERERQARLLSEADAADAHCDKRVAMDERAAALRRCEVALASAQAEHEGAVSALDQARAADVALLEKRHEAEMSGVLAAGHKAVAAAEERHRVQVAELAPLLEAEGARWAKAVENADWALEESVRTAAANEAALAAAHEASLTRVREATEAALAHMERTMEAKLVAERELQKAELSSLPKVIQNLMTAAKLGNLEKHSETVAILWRTSAPAWWPDRIVAVT